VKKLKKKVSEIPITHHTRLKNRLGKGAVPCLASDRWLQFPEVSSGHFKAGEFILLRVMAKGKNEKEKTICRLLVTREDLMEGINAVKGPQ